MNINGVPGPMPVRIEVQGEAMEVAKSYGLKEEDIKRLARYPKSRELDPSTTVRGYTVERRRTGDVTVVVGMRDVGREMVMGVYVHVPGQRIEQTRTAGGGTSSLPTTMRALRARIIAAGYVIKTCGSHDRVETQDGRLITTLPLTPSDSRSIPNAWREFVKKSTDLGNT